MALIAERGLGAASLRELARRLSMSQPSLYHYFASKDELVAQIIEDYTSDLLRESIADTPDALPSLGALLSLLVERILLVWRRPHHATFVRFMFAITMEKPEYGEILQRHLLGRTRTLVEPWVTPLIAAGELSCEDAPHVLDACLGAIQMRFIRQRVLHADPADDHSIDAYAAFVADALTRGARARANHAKDLSE